MTDTTLQGEGAPPSARTSRVRRPSMAGRLGIGMLIAAAVLLGLGLRGWYLFHVPVNSDEAIVGLMAQEILHGHFSAFYWGQPYGGGEPYVVAAMFAAFGQSAFVLGLTAVVLSAGAAILTWRIVRRLVTVPALALLAGALVWVGPDAALQNSTREYGFRGVTMVCGLAAVLAALRLLDNSRRWLDVVALGLFAGLGWWSSPEIGYYLLPAALIAIGAIFGSKSSHWERIFRTLAVIGAFAVGALPWLWANFHSGFASLQPSKFPGGATTRMNTGFGDRLGVFFRNALPIEVDLRRLVSGTFVVGGAPNSGTLHTLGVAIAVVVYAVLAGATVLCIARGGRWSAVGLAVVAFPLLFAAQPGTWYWSDGRYVVFLGPLLAIVLAAGVEQLVRRAPRHRTHRPRVRWNVATVAMSLVALAVGALTVTAFNGDTGTSLRTAASGWGDPNQPVDQAISILEAHGVRAGLADYWVAYKVDLLAKGALTLTPARGDINRSTTINHEVAAAPSRAWIFVPPNRIAAGSGEFSSTPVIDGPAGVLDILFVLALDRIGDPYRVVNAGILQAVIPQRNVTLHQVRGAGG
jgi:hypothetical protein